MIYSSSNLSQYSFKAQWFSCSLFIQNKVSYWETQACFHAHTCMKSYTQHKVASPTSPSFFAQNWKNKDIVSWIAFCYVGTSIHVKGLCVTSSCNSIHFDFLKFLTLFPKDITLYEVWLLFSTDLRMVWWTAGNARWPWSLYYCCISADPRGSPALDLPVIVQ